MVENQLVIQAHQPIERAKGQTKRKHRQTDERDLAHPDGETRIAILVLSRRRTGAKRARQTKEAEEYHGAHEKEMPVEISAFGIERRLVPRRNIHPLIEMVAEEKDRA